MMRRTRATAAASAAAVLLLLTGAPAGAALTPPDPYFPLSGNQRYDVRHYDLDLDFTPASHLLDARATVTASADRSLATFRLDYSGPAVQQVLVDGRPAAYRSDGQKLTVTPARPIRPGALFTVVVRYRGTPERISDPALGDYGWINTPDGAVALNEPDGARTWYPLNDDLRDKATYTFRITTPTGVTALANGEPAGPPQTHDGRTTVTWQMRKPMAGYLSMVAIGDFQVARTTDDGLPNITAYDPNGSDDTLLHPATAQAVAWERKRFGAYPFDSTGGIIDEVGVGYALESQSRPVYDRGPDELTVVHEIAHQWFGDSVTPSTWRDIWLNEGFATYTEWLWQEDHGGPSVQQVFDTYYETPAGDPFWNLETGDPGRDEMFNFDAVYVRGAMTLHALRTTIGDRDFFDLLRTWAHTYRYGTADTGDLLRLAEKLSHHRLGPLFDDWLYTAAKPPLPPH
ncbi:M1 family metallopeptidase [Kitasatospora sp. DSM 101779]|uniref:M1 family metallopeptidase n=1 Tax=Kitasatospora sp. DSM 101779 TaxID=2853165 RepID=UPI0021D9BFDB|nr:M1 family metallopeptidase [Kitasatospora sp. DSM 101779]MCU7826586.1 M1 family metallopeptidase [Kitasatospora sp. DSM 101779]